ncbi:hypothetical protein ACQKII_22410 [Lysinibacillus sp. NPDC048646]
MMSKNLENESNQLGMITYDQVVPQDHLSTLVDWSAGGECS